MRLKLKTLASLKPVAVAVALTVSASGRVVFASEQQPPVQQPTQPPVAQPIPVARPQADAGGPQLQLTADEAVRLALENNLGVRAEKLSPQIGTYGVAQARAVFAPRLFSNTTRTDTTSPPDFLSSGGLAEISTTDRLSTNVGVDQQIPWFGGRYSVALAANRREVGGSVSSFNPQLGSNLAASFTQPLLRNFKIDGLRQQVMIAEKNEEIADLTLREELVSTERRARDAYFQLVGAMGRLEVARQALALANESLRQNERRVEVGAMARIDIIEAQAEVARVEESVLINESNIRAFEDQLRIVILNPAQPDFWTVRLIPTERPALTSQPMDVDAAIANALQNRTDLLAARKRLESVDINISANKNYKLPAIDLLANYNTVGVAGTQFEFNEGFPPTIRNQTQRSFAQALGDVFGQDFKDWSVALQVSYPLGTSPADAALASSRLQREQQLTSLRELEIGITQQIRDAARQVTNSLQRVEATRKAREFAEIRYEAEQKRVTAGLSTTFQLVNAQQALSNARLSETNAIIDYNRALVSFSSLQTSPR